MRERVADLRDVGRQVLLALAGGRGGSALPEQAIVVADDLLPSQLLALPRAQLAGIATAQGGATSHMAIIASAMGVPALVGTRPRAAAGGRRRKPCCWMPSAACCSERPRWNRRRRCRR
jgi:phosphocarrier protein FPr/phosphocarrier protein